MRHQMLILAIAAFATGCGERAVKPVAAAEFRSPLVAFLQICEAPLSHSGIGEAVRALDWPRLTGNQIPKQVIDNGMVTWSEVAEAPDQSLIIAAGRLNETSFCRVYSSRALSGPLDTELERVVVLGKALGAPDFRQRTQDRDVIGWHKSADETWRTVHLSTATTAADSSDLPVVLEMTRLAS